MLACAEAAAAVPALDGCLADLRQRLLTAAWDDLRVGVSFRRTAGHGAVATLFAHAVELFADDLVARDRLLRLSARLGTDMRSYEDSMAGLRPHGGPPVHSMMGLTPEPGGGVRLSVGVAPTPALVPLTAGEPNFAGFMAVRASPSSMPHEPARALR